MGCQKCHKTKTKPFQWYKLWESPYILTYRKVLRTKCCISPHLVSIAQTAQDRLLVPRILAVLDFQQKNKSLLGNKKSPSTWIKRKSFQYSINIAPWCRCLLHILSAQFERHCSILLHDHHIRTMLYFLYVRRHALNSPFPKYVCSVVRSLSVTLANACKF